MQIRRIALAMLAVLSILLSACSSSSPDDKVLNDDPTTPAATASSEAPTEPVRAFPAVGKIQGVVDATPPGNASRELGCAVGYTPVEVPYVTGVEYNGTNILIINQALADPVNEGESDQLSVLVTFTGDVPFEATSLIVNLQAQDTNYKGEPIFIDDRAVNLTRNMLTEAGLTMNTVDFGGSYGDPYITDLTICVPNNT